MKKVKISSSIKYVFIVCLILLLIDLAVGLVLVRRSKDTIKNLVSQRMIGISDTAAYLIDGDLLDSVTEADVKNKTDKYQEIYDILHSFKENNSFEYIYTIKASEEKEGAFVFVIDEDPISPGEFGEEIVYTEALYKASKGEAAVDFTATTDEWGSFYSAFSPIKNNKGEVVGVVGVDFNSAAYEKEISVNSSHFIIMSSVSLLLGAFIVLLVATDFRKKFISLRKEVLVLANDIDSLTDEINKEISEGEEVTKEEKQETEATSEMDVLNEKMHQMQDEMRKYISYVNKRAFLDTMTGVANKSAYLDKVKEIDANIINKKADFTIIVFDLNGLKNINDEYGHECGDRFINNTAIVIKNLFGAENSYRIGGDEFIAILQGKKQKLKEVIEQEILNEIEKFNEVVEEGDFKVSVSFGVATYIKESDLEFRQVFKRADEEMYRFKAEYYRQFGDRRKKES